MATSYAERPSDPDKHEIYAQLEHCECLVESWEHLVYGLSGWIQEYEEGDQPEEIVRNETVTRFSRLAELKPEIGEELLNLGFIEDDIYSNLMEREQIDYLPDSTDEKVKLYERMQHLARQRVKPLEKEEDVVNRKAERYFNVCLEQFEEPEDEELADDSNSSNQAAGGLLDGAKREARLTLEEVFDQIEDIIEYEEGLFDD